MWKEPPYTMFNKSALVFIFENFSIPLVCLYSIFSFDLKPHLNRLKLPTTVFCEHANIALLDVKTYKVRVEDSDKIPTENSALIRIIHSPKEWNFAKWSTHFKHAKADELQIHGHVSYPIKEIIVITLLMIDQDQVEDKNDL